MSGSVSISLQELCKTEELHSISSNKDLKGVNDEESIMEFVENGEMKKLSNIFSTASYHEKFDSETLLSVVNEKWKGSRDKKYKEAFLYIFADMICTNETMRKTVLSRDLTQKYVGSERILNEEDLDLCFLLQYLQNIAIEKALTGDNPELDPDMIDSLPWIASEVHPKRKEMRIKMLDSFVFRNGLTPIQAACFINAMDFLDPFLQMGLNPRSVSDQYEYPAIFIAATLGNYKMFKALCKHDQVPFGDILQSGVCQKDLFCHKFTNDKLPLLGISGPTILHCLLNKPEKDGQYESCFDELFTHTEKLDGLKNIINYKDGNDDDNCPLMLAKFKSWDEGAIRKLMETGANICNANASNDMPLDYIKDETLLDFLDNDCVSKSKQVNLCFLASPRQSKANIPDGSEDGDESEFSEMDTLQQLSMRNKESRSQYMTHPVIKLFLHKKWKRVVSIYNSGIRMHFLFAFCFTWYFMETFGGQYVRQTKVTPGKENASKWQCHRLHKELREDINDMKFGTAYVIFSVFFYGVVIWMVVDIMTDIKRGTNSIKRIFIKHLFLNFFPIIASTFLLIFSHWALFWVLIAYLTVFVITEIFQWFVARDRYFKNKGNYFDLFILATAFFVLVDQDDALNRFDCNHKRVLAAITIIAEWGHYMIMLSQVYLFQKIRLHLYILILFRVITTSLMFLFIFGVFICTYGIGFYIILHDDSDDSLAVKEQEVLKTNVTLFKPFNNPWTSVLKTLTMFIGEVDFNDLAKASEYKTDGTWPLIFFASFLIFLVIVLLNLLNGLIIGDTSKMLQDADYLHAMARIETITYIEHMLKFELFAGNDAIDFMVFRNKKKPFEGGMFSVTKQRTLPKEILQGIDQLLDKRKMEKAGPQEMLKMILHKMN